ncbi:hypothetical protein AGMMS50230_11510 [Spirochaetia bacterium]|nr:hypothetical protein AGMMS50230_11510 [Spirochaetia bacterium]
MKRLVLVLLCALSLAGCSKTVAEILGDLGGNSGNAGSGTSREDNAVKLNKEMRYYNDYLGISYRIPKNWWLYEVNDENFSETKGDITDDVSMDIAYGDFGTYNYSNVWLMTFGNLEKSITDNHLGFDLDARFVKGAENITSFMKYFEEFMLEPTEEEDYSLTNSEQLTINGKAFELRDYLVDRKEDDYQIITLSCQIKEGYFFNIIVDYWPENKKAKQAIIDSVSKSIEFY